VQNLDQAYWKHQFLLLTLRKAMRYKIKRRKALTVRMMNLNKNLKEILLMSTISLMTQSISMSRVSSGTKTLPRSLPQVLKNTVRLLG
jgi:hypothetical protein